MPSTPVGYSGWHPRRLSERAEAPEAGRILYDRPPTPLFGAHTPTREGPRGPGFNRTESQQSLLTLHLEPPEHLQAPRRRPLRERAQSLSMRVPLPQGISGVVAVCSAVAFALSVTTLAIGMSNRRMLLAATEARHDPHGALARLIFTSVWHALQMNGTAPPPGAPPFDTIMDDPT